MSIAPWLCTLLLGCLPLPGDPAPGTSTTRTTPTTPPAPNTTPPPTTTWSYPCPSMNIPLEPPEIDSGTQWSEQGIHLTLEHQNAADYAADWLADGCMYFVPAQVRLDLTGLACDVRYVVAPVEDHCPLGCTQLEVYAGGKLVGTDQTPGPGLWSMVVNSLDAPVDEIVISSEDGDICWPRLQ